MIDLDGPLVATVWKHLWQVTALILAVAAANRVFCKRRPHLAHTLWLLVFLKCLTPPLWSSPTSLFSWLQRANFNPPVSSGNISLLRTDVDQSGEDLAPTLAGPKSLQESGAASGEIDPSTLVLPIVGLGWLGGALACGLVALSRWRQAQRLLLHRRGVVDPALESLLAQLAGHLGLRRPVRLIITCGPQGPAALGLLSPTVLLPEVLTHETPAQLEPILAHELIHLRRGDHYFGLLQTLVQVLWWFHPLVWWANRSANRVIERCCDEEVVSGLPCTPANYARCLLDVLDLRHTLQAVHLSPGMRPVEVTAHRLENIMKCANGFHRRTPRWCWALLALAVALVLPGKELRPSQAEAQEITQETALAPQPVPPPQPVPAPAPQVPPPAPKVMPKEVNRQYAAEAIRLQNAQAGDVASAINDFFTKRQGGNEVIVTAEPISNHLFVSAVPDDLAHIKRLVKEMDVPPKQFFIEVIVYEGDLAPNWREASDKGKIDVLARPQLMTLENQMALVNIGREIELGPGNSVHRRNVGLIYQVTVGRATGKQVPVRIVTELSSVSKDGTTLNTQHMEHSANYPVGERIRIRGGNTEKGKDVWVDMVVEEVTTREEMNQVMKKYGR